MPYKSIKRLATREAFLAFAVFMLLLVISLATMTGCDSEPPGAGLDSVVASTMAIAPKVEKYELWPNQAYAKMALSAVKKEGLVSYRPTDKNDFCPNGMTEKNWVNLIGALASYESNFKTDQTFKESFKDSKGAYVISRGLTQLSIESANGYGCGIKKASDLHDPQTNLNCTAKIIKRWLSKDGQIANHSGSTYRGMSRYWSVMRPSGKLSLVKSKLKPVCE